MSISKLLLTAIAAVVLTTTAMATTTVVDNLPPSMANMLFDLKLADTAGLIDHGCGPTSSTAQDENLMCLPGVYAKDFVQAINIAGPYMRVCDPSHDPKTGTGLYCQHVLQLPHCQLDAASLDGKTVTLSVDPTITNPTVADLQCAIA
jgi:hypothetical protein